MKLSQFTKDAFRAQDLISEARFQLDVARKEIELISWISPAGDFYIEPRSVIQQIIADRSW